MNSQQTGTKHCGTAKNHGFSGFVTPTNLRPKTLRLRPWSLVTMKKPSPLSIPLVALVALLAGVVLLQSGCRKSRPPLRPEAAAFYPERLRYYLNEYEQHGKRSPQWDSAMREFLEEHFYNNYAGSPTLPAGLLKAFEKLDKAKCDDPFFRYLSASYVWSRTTQPYPYATYAGAYEAIKNSDYGPVIQLGAARSYALVTYHQTDEARRKLCFSLQAEAFEHMLKTIADPSVPDEVIAAPIESFFDWSGRAEPKSAVRERTPRLKAAIEQYRSGRPLMLRLLGQLEIELAWADRGGSWAYEVNQAGWAGFASHLDEAEKLLERSWQLLPNSRTAGSMITVELGQARGRERMELWFSRAMQMNPASDEACYAKLHYLRPRWHGSHEEMLRFGVECTENPAWSGKVPLVLAFAMESYLDDYPEADRPRLWKDPKVWALVKKSYEAYLKKYPDDEEARHAYLEKAYRSAAWEDFGKQFKKIGGSIKQIYMSREKLEQMLQAYAEHEASKR